MTEPESSLRERIEALQRVGTELRERLVVDPLGTIARAREVAVDDVLSAEDVAGIQAGIFIDAGTDQEDRQIIEEGVDLLRGLLAAAPDRLDLLYNLANGLSSLAQTTVPDGQRYWYLITSEMRREARRLFAEVVTASRDHHPDLAASAKTNQANLLWQSHRWVEAYEAFRLAVRLDPTNAVASSGAARLLLQAAKRGLGPREALEGIAVRYIALARRDGGAPSDLPPHLEELIRALPDEASIRAFEPDLREADEYTRFVARHHLALTLSIEGLRPNLKRWDNLTIASITEDLSVGDEDLTTGQSGVPPTFAAFNQLKADFLAARWCAYQAIEARPVETGYYADTLDYAMYGVRQSLLTLAQRSAIDVLDRVAVAVSEYLGLPGTPDSVAFTTRWHRFRKGKPVQPPEWQAEITQEIAAGNLALVALSELAEDIAKGGFLSPQKTLRSISTHRLVVLHDMGTTPSRESRFLAHYDAIEFQEQTIEALRIARAAIFYFAALIGRREAVKRQKSDSVIAPLEVPPHHYVRGEDDYP